MENCIFSKIAKGETNTKIIYEDNLIVVFNDISPAAKAHLLIIPKRPIKNMNYLKNTEEDKNLVKHMEEVGEKLLNKTNPNDEHRLGFTQPPFNTVPYLHMHVLALPLTCSFIRAPSLNPNMFFWTTDMILNRLNKSK
ncbi:HIT-like protein [Anaeromyces robustus]|uniref:HIT-like protein n=1 Tax=Anaeromyces robustus TaxID=1754192 RepID=A0A1Y1X449_9FUNG|nr:HIT-like protein [Anaeromyces robustus]|eukprot:ORX80146.1 HIT-like protein [Anaeromyces robustus]